MRVAFLLLMLLACAVALNASTAITLCSTGSTPSGCAGTYSYSYTGEDSQVHTGTPVALGPANRFSGWAAATLGSWVSIQNQAALTPAGMQLFSPSNPDGAITSDPYDEGSTHTWTHIYYVSYILTFAAPLLETGTGHITGTWAADDDGGFFGGTGIYLNGVRYAGMSGWGEGSYGTRQSFDFAPSNLNAGSNTLTFLIQHANSWYDGVLVDSLSLSGTPAPEPASLLLVAAGAALLVFRRRRC